MIHTYYSSTYPYYSTIVIAVLITPQNGSGNHASDAELVAIWEAQCAMHQAPDTEPS